MSPKRSLQAASILFFSAWPASAQADWGTPPDYVTPRKEIVEKIHLSPPTALPRMLETGLGVSHVSGRYHFTEKPFLVEGAETVRDLGYPALKLWFNNPKNAYPFNSDWSSLGDNPTLVEMARHPYYQAAFAMPFKVFSLEVQSVHVAGRAIPAAHFIDPDSDFSADEAQVYELSKHLLETYGARDVTFILQNWEGDWMLRGKAREEWKRGDFVELDRRRDAFVRWFSARQRAVDRARREHPSALCKILHAVEVNRVLDDWKGVATVTNQILPRIDVDLISWSCYDGLESWKKSAESTAVSLWQGLDTIQHFAKRKPDGSKAVVMIGEIGLPERREDFTPETTEAVYNGALATFAARDVPYVFIWEIYCNEIAKDLPKEVRDYKADELNGFWIKQPDGKLGYTGKYFERLLKR